MLELCLAALQLMTKDSQVHNELLHTAGLLTTVVQLLYSPSESVQRASVAFLSQLAASRAGAKAIEQEGACPRLTEMIQSNNEYIAAYSAAVLHRITRDKPDEYRRRLSLELRQSLFDGGLLIEPQSADPHSVSDLWTPGLKESTSRLHSPRPNSIHSAKLKSARGVTRLCQLLNLNPQRQEITEPICSALRHVTHRSSNVDAAIYEIRSNQTLPVIVELLQNNDDSSALPLIKSAVGLIRNLATDEESRIELKLEGACPRLTEMIQSNNEYIAAYSAAVLHRITRDKPDEYRRRLSLELRQSLFDGGLLIEPQSADPHSVSDLWTPGLKESTSRLHSPRPNSIHSAKLKSARR
ncbi:hypothetical protein AHF37_04168 [Paragonimus kellicotti]|nr:hypothetical protein AHF37_04168 [Paragonimus kellicotti]